MSLVCRTSEQLRVLWNRFNFNLKEYIYWNRCRTPTVFSLVTTATSRHNNESRFPGSTGMILTYSWCVYGLRACTSYHIKTLGPSCYSNCTTIPTMIRSPCDSTVLQGFLRAGSASESRVSRPKGATVVLSQTELRRGKCRDGETDHPLVQGTVTDMSEGARENLDPFIGGLDFYHRSSGN